MTSFSLAMTHYSDEEISRLAREPGMDDSYKSLCGLLTSVKMHMDTTGSTFWQRGGRKTVYPLTPAIGTTPGRVDYNGPTTPV